MDIVTNTLRLFELVAERGTIGVSELARLTGDPKSTVQRGLLALHGAGWLSSVQDGARRRWTITPKLALLAGRTDTLADLPALAAPVMQALCEDTRETIHLMRHDGRNVVLIAKLDSPQALRTVRQLGAQAPLHVTSNGKAILAAMSDTDQDRYLAGDLKPWTARSLVDRGALAADLRLVRERGFALSDGELDPNVRAVAAAILGKTGYPIAALSISCPAVRLTDALVPALGGKVRSAAEAISERLEPGAPSARIP